MTKTTAVFALALWAGLWGSNAWAACYVVYDKGHQVVYRSVHPPVDLSVPLHRTVPGVVPGGTLVFSPDEEECRFEVNRLARYAPQDRPAQVLRAPRAPRG